MTINKWENVKSQSCFFPSDLEEQEGVQGCPERAPGSIWDDLGEHFGAVRSAKAARRKGAREERH